MLLASTFVRLALISGLGLPKHVRFSPDRQNDEIAAGFGSSWNASFLFAPPRIK